MANNVNLSPARVVRAAIMHTLDNGVKWNEIGTLQAVRSPQLAGLTKEMSPESALAEGRLSFRKGSGGVDDIIPTVTMNYRTQYAPGTIKTTRSVDNDGETVKQAQTLDVDYNLHREYPHRFNSVDFLELENQARAYYEAFQKNVVTTNLSTLSGLAAIGLELMLTMEMGMLQPTNNDVLSALIAGIGGNLSLGKTAPANRALPVIPLFNSEGVVLTDFWEFCNALKRDHNVKGRLIVIGGSLAAKFFDKEKIVTVADLVGLDQQKVYSTLPIEFFYDPQVDILLGQDQILILDPGSACMQTILEHQYIVKTKQAANTTFGTAAVSIAQYDSGTFTLPMDIRVREYDTGKYPFWIVTPSFHFGTYVRPTGYFKNYGGWNTVTGIWKAKLTRTAEVVTP